jgi:hypothetical protein
MPNDVPMLRWAGTGVAVADAHPEAIAAASFVAPACIDDGVAQVVERLLTQGSTPPVPLPSDPVGQVHPDALHPRPRP